MFCPPLKNLTKFLIPISQPKLLSSISHSFQPKPTITRISFAFKDHNFTPLFQVHYVDQILFKFRSKPISAITFFDWSESVLGFNHSLRSYCNLAHLLLSNRLFCDAHQVLDKMLERFWELDVFVALCDGFRTFGTNPGTVYSLLLDGFCRNGRVDKGVDTFLRMSKIGVDVAPYALRRMLDSLVSCHCVDGIVTVLDEKCRGLEAFDVYKFVIVGFARKNLFELALCCHRKMIDRGLVPGVFSCNKILKALCDMSALGAAFQFFCAMIEVGPSPNVVTFSTLIGSYCKEKRSEEAFKRYNLMLQRGIALDFILYSILIDGLFRNGKVDAGYCLLCFKDGFQVRSCHFWFNNGLICEGWRFKKRS